MRNPGPMICTVTPTVMSGTVVRWYYPGTESEEPGTQAPVSASRDGVMVGIFLHEVPEEVLAKANEVFEILRDNGPRELVQDLATHRREFPSWRLVPILREEDTRPSPTEASGGAR